LERDPATLPRRRHSSSDRQPLTPSEQDRQDRIREFRDIAARNLNLDPTLIASRSQLALLAREPGKLDELLLGWQAALLRDCPVFASSGQANGASPG
jgi:ribonuclease D